MNRLRDEKFMEIALTQAEQAARRGEVPVGAVLVDADDNRILAQAGNRCVGSNDPSAHAEILVLREGGCGLGNYRLTGTTLYVTIEPCPMCAGALVHARIKRLVFGASDRRTGACGSLYNIVQDNRLNHRITVERGILGSRCTEIMKDFFRSRRRK